MRPHGTTLKLQERRLLQRYVKPGSRCLKLRWPHYRSLLSANEFFAIDLGRTVIEGIGTPVELRHLATVPWLMEVSLHNSLNWLVM